MFGVGVHHGGVGLKPVAPPDFEHRGDWHRRRRACSIWNASEAGGDDAFIGEIADLLVGVVPIADEQRLLGAQHLEHRGVLFFAQRIGR